MTPAKEKAPRANVGPANNARGNIPTVADHATRRRASAWTTANAAASAITPAGYHLEAIYRYGDQAAVVRYEDCAGKKTFRQLSVDGGMWMAGAPKGKWPLFGPIPTETAAPIIFVSEGETACLAARAIGIPCVCSSGGSVAAPKSDWSPLAGRKVAILPDNDAPGRKYAGVVSTLLSALDPPATAKRVILPDLPERGDIVDYIAARHDHGEIPPRVDYSLTPLGRSLEPVLMAMHRWSEAHPGTQPVRDELISPGQV